MSLSTTEYSRAVEVDENRLHEVELNEEESKASNGATQQDSAATTASDEVGPELTEEEFKARRTSRNKKIMLGLLLVAFVIFVIIDALTTGFVRSGIDSFLAWIEANPAPGFFVFMIVYFVATILFVPGSILTLGAGFVFANAFGLGVGVLLGALSVFFGASAGAILSFLLGRYLLRDWVKTLTKKYAIFEALDAALVQKGFRIMALLRLSPIIPFNAINYIAGVTAVSLRDYCLSLIAIVPGTTLYVFLGASAGSLTDSASSGDHTTVTIVVVVVGAILGVGAIILTSYYAKKELNRVIAEREASTTALEQEEEVDLEAQQQVEDQSPAAEADIPVVVE
jgi:uncharacterized membrane protein YdjX (TVP38/TMEM64 family)